MKYRVGFDGSVYTKNKGGTAVAVKALEDALKNNQPKDIELIFFKGPNPVLTKNPFTKIINFVLEVSWLHIILPFRIWANKIQLLHMPASLASFSAPCPQILTINDVIVFRHPEWFCDSLYKGYLKISQRLSLKVVKRIIVCSKSSRIDIIELLGIHEDRIETVHYGIGFEDVHRTPSDEYTPIQYKPYLLYVGDSGPRKNLIKLIEAFKYLVTNYPLHGYSLVIVGPFDKNNSDVGMTIKMEELNERVKVLGYVNENVLSSLYDNAEVFVFPSLYEGFGFTPLEAMRHGLPVVASNRPCMPEILGKAALYVDPTNALDISKTIYSILSNNELKQETIQRGYEQVKLYSWEKTAENTLTIYRKLLKQIP